MTERLRDLDPEQQMALRPVARARALLELGADRIELLDTRPKPPADDPRRAAYDRFQRSAWIVRRLAAKKVIYDGGDRLGAVVLTSDPRLEAIGDLAELASVSEQDLDRRTIELAEIDDRCLAEVETYMDTLPRPDTRPCRRRTTVSDQDSIMIVGPAQVLARWREARLDG